MVIELELKSVIIYNTVHSCVNNQRLNTIHHSFIILYGRGYCASCVLPACQLLVHSTCSLTGDRLDWLPKFKWWVMTDCVNYGKYSRDCKCWHAPFQLRWLTNSYLLTILLAPSNLHNSHAQSERMWLCNSIEIPSYQCSASCPQVWYLLLSYYEWSCEGSCWSPGLMDYNSAEYMRSLGHTQSCVRL